MKPKLTLLILGSLQILQSILVVVFARTIVETFLNVRGDALEVGVLMHYGLSPAFLMIGLILLFARKFEFENQKKVLLALIIGYLPLFGVFYHFSTIEIMNFNIESIAPDIIMFGLALFTYLNPKK